LNTDVKLKLPLTTVLIKNLMLFGVLTILLNLIVKLRPQLISPNLWYSIALFGYIVCTSGIIYCQSHNMPMFRLDKDEFGNMFISEYFMKQQRSQYAGEGYIASILCTLISLCFLCFVRAEVFFSPLNSTNKMYLLVVLLILGYSGVQAFLACYREKSPWYRNAFFPPHDYVRGPLMRDQGNNI
jgi:uncharacterized membrane protein YoaT (DUF817 family)